MLETLLNANEPQLSCAFHPCTWNSSFFFFFFFYYRTYQLHTSNNLIGQARNVNSPRSRSLKSNVYLKFASRQPHDRHRADKSPRIEFFCVWNGAIQWARRSFHDVEITLLSVFLFFFFFVVVYISILFVLFVSPSKWIDCNSTSFFFFQSYMKKCPFYVCFIKCFFFQN